jgi:radical SAM protein with 4Fe4S-binding SPASM domain
MAWLDGWREFPRWLFHDALPSVPVANGALGMGCIGYPGHPVWEVTAGCNLGCIHCHAASGKPDPQELSTEEGKRLIEQIAEIDAFRTLVYTGGEPLVRPDIFALLRHSQEIGFANIVATNGILIDFVDRQGVIIMLMYQLVAVGRGEKIKNATLKKTANRELSHLIASKQKRTKTIIEPVAGPQYWPYLLEKDGHPGKIVHGLAKRVFHGCAAGRSFVYIKSNGDVWPCPFVEVKAGNVREHSFREIYEESPVFRNLRNREKTLKGICGECVYRTICGGCRGRAYAYSGDYLAEDPRCFIRESRKGERGGLRTFDGVPGA